MQLVRKKSFRNSKRRKLELQKWNERKRQENISTNIESSDNEEDNQTQTKKARTKSSLQISTREERRGETVPSTSKQQMKVYRNLTEETPLHKPKTRFKQTKLNFQIKQTENSSSSISENPLFASKPHNKPENPKKKLKIIPLGTSTPLHRSPRKRVKIFSPEIDNITDIEAPKQTANKFNDFENSHLTNKKIKKRKIPKSIHITKSSQSINGSSSQLPAVVTNQRYMRSMKNKKVKK